MSFPASVFHVCKAGIARQNSGGLSKYIEDTDTVMDLC